ncbi:MAG: response regulator [Candidatus Scalindua sp.]|nr:response regulator [Candidatus Scalindua sp.]
MGTERQASKSILVVDDSPTNLTLMVEVLTEAGYDTLVANSGDHTLDQLSRHLPDLILLDIMMPGLNGFETCCRIKANPDTSEIPVIFMTALDDINNTVKGFEVGGVDYITKPFRQAEMLVRIDTHMTICSLKQQLKLKNTQLHDKNVQLEAALERVNLLSGILPICCNCKKIRDVDGSWQDVVVYVRDNSEADFTHGICPDCKIELYPETNEEK